MTCRNSLVVGLLTAETQDYNHGPDEKLIAHAYKLADLMLKERTK